MTRTHLPSLASSALAALAAAVLASGCSGPGDKKSKDGPKDPPTVPDVAADDGDGGPVPIDLFTDEDRYTGVPEDKLTFRDEGGSAHSQDSEVNFDSTDKAKFDAFCVAQWVKSRRAIIDWCITQKKSGQEYYNNERGGYETSPYKRVFPDDPKREATRLDQALSIAIKVVEKVPDTPEARLRLAQMCFVKGAYHFWVIDAGSWELLDAKEKEAGIARLPEEKRDAATKEYKAKIARVEATLEHHRKRMIAYHLLALKQFQAYEAALPLPGNHPTDYYFKINFQLGNIKEALKYLVEILDNPELKPETRVKYESIEKDIRDFLAEREVNEAAPLPGSPERVRKNGAKRENRPQDEDPGPR